MIELRPTRPSQHGLLCQKKRRRRKGLKGGFSNYSKREGSVNRLKVGVNKKE